MAKLDLEAFKAASAQVLELGEKVNSTEGEVKYALKRDIRKAAQAAKVAAQEIRVAANSLGKK